MRLTNRLAALGLWVLCGLAAPVLAEDTDIFIANPGVGGQRPNVLIIVDNTANWSSNAVGGTKFALEKAALQAVVSQTSAERYNIGLMLFSESGGGNGNPDGGYVRFAIRSMTLLNRWLLVSLVGGLDIRNDKGNGANYGLAMLEAYEYFRGLNSYSGYNKVKADSLAWLVKPRYRSPVTDTCARNQIIFISNGAPDNGENSSARQQLALITGRTTSQIDSEQITLSPSGRQEIWADEYARFLAQDGNDINTYTIDVNPLTNGNGPDNTALLRSMATQGKGRYYVAYTGADLQLALQKALNEILSINSVYASTALPVSVNVRGTYLNEVYMAEFRPDAHARPRWWGNLKLYQLAVDTSTDTLVLADSATPPQAAQNPVTGFIRSDVVSFWTQPSAYWSFLPSGTPPSASDSPDGEVVEKGGSAQLERNAWPSRNLYTCTGTCTGGSLLSAYPFAATNSSLSVAALGVTGETERLALIAWMQGQDNSIPAERSYGQVRPSLHGDVVHSRPAVVNYNRSGTDADIVTFFGSNEGVVRAVKGGKTTTGAGTELWGFVAPEFFTRLKRMRDNDPDINVPAAQPPASTLNNKPYFFDGNPSIYTNDANSDGRINAADGDTAWLFITMRRGGRFLYAFDVSTPESPRLLWKRSNTDTGYGQLGQTWSDAKVARIRLTREGVTATVPVLIMGAGYDPTAEDVLPAGTATQGRGVLVIDALTGALIWQVGPSPSGATYNLTEAGMTYGIAATVTPIDRDGNGYIDRVYAVDTGANVWRLDLGDTAPANWRVYLLAALGIPAGDRTGVNARKFLYPPDVVYGADAAGLYDAVLLGSGDREQPFSTTVANRFYMLKDRLTGLSGAGTTTIHESDLYDATGNLIQVGNDTERASAGTALRNARGWYITLGLGEKAVGGTITIAGTVFFGTNQWNTAIAGACNGNLGLARIYAMSYKDATVTLNLDGLSGLATADRILSVPGGGLLPSPTHAILETVPRVGVSGSATGTYQTVCFGPTCVAPPAIASDQVRRLFWNRCIEGEGEGADGVTACGN